MERSPGPAQKRTIDRRALIAIAIAACGGAALAIPYLMWGPRSFVMFGPSMEPSFHDGDRLLALPGAPEPGDVVVARSPMDDVLIVKRVIAIGPARVTIDEHARVFVNGRPLEREDGCSGIEWQSERATDQEACFVEHIGRRAVPILETPEYWDDEHLTDREIPLGSCFVMGDFRSRSNDSRNPAFGALPLANVIGVVVSEPP